jgi:hypothetical protein
MKPKITIDTDHPDRQGIHDAIGKHWGNKTPGKLVTYTTQDNTVQHGRTYNRDNLVNGKVVVYLLTPDKQHIKDEQGQDKKMLVDGKKLIIEGFID